MDTVWNRLKTYWECCRLRDTEKSSMPTTRNFRDDRNDWINIDQALTVACSSFMPFESCCQFPRRMVASFLRKRYTSEFWRICCNFSMMKRFVCGEYRIFLLFSLSAYAVDSSWRSYNIFFKILRYTSSENTVKLCHSGEKAMVAKFCGFAEIFPHYMAENCFFCFVLFCFEWQKLSGPSSVLFINIVGPSVVVHQK